MKKLLLPVALTLTAVGSWAFYPKATEPTGYMMIISNPHRGGFGSGLMITTVAPDGSQQEQTIKVKSGLFTNLTEVSVEVHKAELAVLNTYIRSGWQLVSATPSTLMDTGPAAGYQTVYLLEKR